MVLRENRSLEFGDVGELVPSLLFFSEVGTTSPTFQLLCVAPPTFQTGLK
jgi:hypothetical protein